MPKTNGEMQVVKVGDKLVMDDHKQIFFHITIIALTLMNLVASYMLLTFAHWIYISYFNEEVLYDAYSMKFVVVFIRTQYLMWIYFVISLSLGVASHALVAKNKVHIACWTLIWQFIIVLALISLVLWSSDEFAFIHGPLMNIRVIQ